MPRTPPARETTRLLREFGTDYEIAVGRYFGRAAYRETTLPNSTSLDFTTLVARVDSSSYMPREADATYPSLLAKLRALFDTHQQGGTIRIDYVTRVFYGEISS